MYITPKRVATMGLGVDLSTIDDPSLRAICARATATIDAVCNVPRLPQKHDFRGGVVTKERHRWVIDEEGRPRPNRVFPFHDPIVSVERFDIFSDNTNKVAIDPTSIVINNTGGYLEVASLLLTQWGVFGAGLVPYVGLYEPIVEIDYTYRTEFEVVDEIAELVDGQTFQTVNQFWLPTAAVTVKVNGTTKTITTDYTLDKTEGWVIFGANQPADALVEVSYTYTLPWEIHQAAGLLVAEEMGDIDVRGSGLTGLDVLRVTQGGGASVEKVREGRSRRSAGSATGVDDLPPEVGKLLAGFVYVTAR